MSLEQKKWAYEEIWPKILFWSKENSTEMVALAVYSYVLHRLEEDAKSEMGQVFSEMEKRFRKENTNIFLIACDTKLPWKSRNGKNEPTRYHVQVFVGTRKNMKKEWKKYSSTKIENDAKLLMCGFLNEKKEEELLQKKKDNILFPVNLKRDFHFYFDKRSLLFHDTDLSVFEKCVIHAENMQKEVHDDQFKSTGIQVTRTNMSVEKWTDTRKVIEKQIAERIPIAISDTSGVLKEQIIPVGYAILGYTPEESVLFDLYLVTETKLHLSFCTEDAERLRLRRFENDEELQDFINSAVMSQKEELSGENRAKISVKNLHRQIHVSNESNPYFLFFP